MLSDEPFQGKIALSFPASVVNEFVLTNKLGLPFVNTCIRIHDALHGAATIICTLVWFEQGSEGGATEGLLQ